MENSVDLVANSVGFDSKPNSVASDLGPHCLFRLSLPILRFLFVLRFYGPVNPMGSCRAWSVYLTTRLLGRLSPLSG